MRSHRSDRSQIIHVTGRERAIALFPHATLIRNLIAEFSRSKTCGIHHASQGYQSTHARIHRRSQYPDSGTHTVPYVGYWLPSQHIQNASKILDFLGDAGIHKVPLRQSIT